LMMSKKVE